MKQSVCLAAGSLQEADFSPAVVSPLLCLHSRLFLRLSNNPQYTSVFGRMRTVHVHFLSYSWTVFCSSLHVSRAEPAGVGLLSEPGPDAMQGECFEVLLICFFCFCPCFINQKYCSFKYCALHRIFCHKLVNIYIFFFSIFRHILSYIQDNKMLLFSFVIFFVCFFFFKEKSLRMFVDSFQSFHKSERCDSSCFCVEHVCKINLYRMFETKTINRTTAETNIDPVN